MIHLYIFWPTGWELWRSLPAEIGRRQVERLRGLGVPVEYIGF